MWLFLLLALHLSPHFAYSVKTVCFLIILHEFLVSKIGFHHLKIMFSTVGGSGIFSDLHMQHNYHTWLNQRWSSL